MMVSVELWVGVGVGLMVRNVVCVGVGGGYDGAGVVVGWSR